MVIAYEMDLRRLTQRTTSPTPDSQTIVMLAKQGECDPVRLEQRAIEIMAGQPPDLARST